VKLSWRAAASKAFSALSGGSRRKAIHLMRKTQAG
jgi:hypothetical protein